ncbi:nucleotide exchange factor GrpE [Pectinatus frisingensis]|uniref:nucleotide exchange factor GrpE n=1 Tax=Pectinatus frisingensis TaxID=865 RepID=UPI0018C49F0F|nr:nucleotide exchange factor GrpE [Pectinatus frisingensis]
MPYIKDDMKKKDSEKLDDMKKEIYEAVSVEAQKLSDENKHTEEDQQKPAVEKSADDEADKKPADIDSLMTQLTAGEKSLAEADDRFKRLQADFTNFRRRSTQEKSEIADVVLQGLIKDMLPILDNFERALAVEGDDIDALKKGIKMVFTQFNEVLVKNGLETIKTTGEKFDPNFHQAVMRVQDAEKEDNTIEQELQKGYIVHGRVIRPSMVKVVSN